MDVLANMMWIIEQETQSEFIPVLLMGVSALEGDLHIQVVANEQALEIVLDALRGREHLHQALDQICDSFKPPDDQPQDSRLQVKRFLISKTGSPDATC